jgi:hypothetical protein
LNKLGRYAEPSAEQIAADQPSLSVNCVTPLEVSFFEMLDVCYGVDRSLAGRDLRRPKADLRFEYPKSRQRQLSAIGHQETFGLAFQFPANESVTPVFF